MIRCTADFKQSVKEIAKLWGTTVSKVGRGLLHEQIENEQENIS